MLCGCGCIVRVYVGISRKCLSLRVSLRLCVRMRVMLEQLTGGVRVPVGSHRRTHTHTRSSSKEWCILQQWCVKLERYTTLQNTTRISECVGSFTKSFNATTPQNKDEQHQEPRTSVLLPGSFMSDISRTTLQKQRQTTTRTLNPKP